MMFKRVMYIMILFGLIFNTGKVNSSEIYLKGEFSVITLPSYLQDATNFRLMRTGELIEDETAFGGVCAKVGTGYWPINTFWKFYKFDALYTLYVHAKIKKPPSDPNSSIFYCGFYGRPGKRFWMFTRSVKAKDTKDGEWKTYKICSFHPRRDQHVYIAKGSASEVYVDLIWFEEEGKKSPEIPLYWNKVNYEDSHWKKISLPFTWEGEKFKGTLLFRKKVIIPKEWQSKGIIALKCPGEKTLVYINGNKLRRAKENLYFIPSPFINFGKENLVAIQVYGILNKGYVIPPLGKLYLLTSTLSAPNWIKESNVRKVSLGGYKILFRVEKDVLKPRELSRVDLTIIEGKNVNPYLYPKLYLENIPFPLSPATKLGYHTTWISSPKMGKYTLKLAIAKRKVSLCEIKVTGDTPSLIKGLFYYTYTPVHGKNTGLIDRDLKPRPQLEALRNVFQKIKPILPILLSLRKAEDIATTETPECVVTTRKSPEGNYYLFVVNKDTGKEKTVRIKFDEKKFISLPTLIDLFTKKRMEIEKSVFSFTLKPGEGKIYQIIKSEEVKKLINSGRGCII